MYQPAIPPLHEGRLHALVSLAGKENDFSVLLSFPGARGPMYPLGPYPMIAEFRAMLAAFTPKTQDAAALERRAVLRLRHRARQRNPSSGSALTTNGITFGFSAEEWKAVRELFRRAWEMPEVRAAWDVLILDYGEL